MSLINDVRIPLTDVFEKYPLGIIFNEEREFSNIIESVLRKTTEVIIRDQVDLNELELKKVDVMKNVFGL